MRNDKGRYKIGAKLFSVNIKCIDSVQKLYSAGKIDYIELMAIPGKNNIKYWEKVDIPFIIHVPHASYGFNLSDPEMLARNEQIFNESRKCADRLNSAAIIIHPGLIGSTRETIRQIKRFKDERLVIENKPFISLRQTKCVGCSPEEIRLIMKEAGTGFCLDVAHAVKAAYANGQDHMVYLKRFLALRPKVIHLCDCKINGCFDEHLNLGKGELDFCRIIDMALEYSPKASFTLEVPEKSHEKLDGYKNDRQFLAGCFKKRR